MLTRWDLCSPYTVFQFPLGKSKCVLQVLAQHGKLVTASCHLHRLLQRTKGTGPEGMLAPGERGNRPTPLSVTVGPAAPALSPSPAGWLSPGATLQSPRSPPSPRPGGAAASSPASPPGLRTARHRHFSGALLRKGYLLPSLWLSLFEL